MSNYVPSGVSPAHFIFIKGQSGPPAIIYNRDDWGVRAGERRDCSGQALEAEGFELLRVPFFLRGKARSSYWSQEGARENSLQRAALPD